MKGERGSASVELALGLPLLLLVILGGVHLGLVVMARHQLADAASYAARAATLAGDTRPAGLRASVIERLGPGTACGNVVVTSRVDTDALGVTRLELTAQCAVSTGIGGALLGAIGPGQLTVHVAQPM